MVPYFVFAFGALFFLSARSFCVGLKIRIIRSITARTIVSAVLLRTGYSTVNCIRWSIIEVTYFHSIPAAVADTDCIIKLTDIL